MRVHRPRQRSLVFQGYRMVLAAALQAVALTRDDACGIGPGYGLFDGDHVAVIRGLPRISVK